jgi:hypothetical protein
MISEQKQVIENENKITNKGYDETNRWADE